MGDIQKFQISPDVSSLSRGFVDIFSKKTIISRRKSVSLSKKRSFAVISAIADPSTAVAFSSASSEVAAALGALAFSVASIGSLGLVISKANYEEPKPIKLAAAPVEEPAMAFMDTAPMVVEAVIPVTTAVEAEEQDMIQSSTFDIVAASQAASQARDWISAWRDRTIEDTTGDAIEEINTVTAQPTDLPQMDPATILAGMAADAPVGITAAEPIAAPAEPESALVTAGSVTVLDENRELAALREKEYKEKLTKIFTDSKDEYQRSHTAAQAASAAANGVKRGVVVIAEEYEAKVQNMWAAFAAKKVQQSQLVAKQEKLLMDLEELNKAREAGKAIKPSVAEQIVAYFQNLYQAIISFVSAVIARFNGSDSPGTASA